MLFLLFRRRTRRKKFCHLPPTEMVLQLTTATVQAAGMAHFRQSSSRTSISICLPTAVISRLPCSTFPLHLLCIIGMEIRFLVMTYGIIHDWITSLTAVVTKVTNMCARLSKLGSSGTKPWNVGLFPSSPSNRLKREEIFSSCANTGGRRWHFE